jgi:cold shock CspA family protein
MAAAATVEKKPAAPKADHVRVPPIPASLLKLGPQVTGTVVLFNIKRGFGFIQPQGAAPADKEDKTKSSDIFFHYTTLSGEGFRTIRRGTVVSYKVASLIDGAKPAEGTTFPHDTSRPFAYDVSIISEPTPKPRAPKVEGEKRERKPLEEGEAKAEGRGRRRGGRGRGRGGDAAPAAAGDAKPAAPRGGRGSDAPRGRGAAEAPRGGRGAAEAPRGGRGGAPAARGAAAPAAAAAPRGGYAGAAAKPAAAEGERRKPIAKPADAAPKKA